MSKEVKRYNFDVDKFGWPRAYESEHGRWIKRDDYDALLAERDAYKKDAERYRAFRKAGLPNGLGVYDAELDAACDELIEEQREDA